MIRVLLFIIVQLSFLSPTTDLFTKNQDTPVYNIAVEDFNKLKSAFLEYSTSSEAHKLIHSRLDEMQVAIGQVHTNQQDRQMLNSLVLDIKAFKALLSGLISDMVPDHLKENSLSRIKTIFGHDCIISELKVRMSNEDSNEIEFIEIAISKLRVTYFHNKSKTASYGLRIKCKGSHNGNTYTGECGAMNGEYTPLNNNVDGNYTRVTYAQITERF